MNNFQLIKFNVYIENDELPWMIKKLSKKRYDGNRKTLKIIIE